MIWILRLRKKDTPEKIPENIRDVVIYRSDKQYWTASWSHIWLVPRITCSFAFVSEHRDVYWICDYHKDSLCLLLTFVLLSNLLQLSVNLTLFSDPLGPLDTLIHFGGVIFRRPPWVKAWDWPLTFGWLWYFSSKKKEGKAFSDSEEEPRPRWLLCSLPFSLSVSLSIFLYICLSVYQSCCLSVNESEGEPRPQWLLCSLPLRLSVYLPLCPSVCLFVCISVCLSIRQFACLPVSLKKKERDDCKLCCLPFCLSYCLYVCLYVCLLVCRSVW